MRQPASARHICPTRVELVAAAVGTALVAVRLVEERQWLPLDILVAVAAAYVVVRPSARAALAYVIGALALFGAVEGVLDARWNGLALRQLPAFLLAPAGVALVAAGIVALRSKSRVAGARRVGRWALTALATLLLAYLFVVSTASALWLTGKPRVAVRTFVLLDLPSGTVESVEIE